MNSKRRHPITRHARFARSLVLIGAAVALGACGEVSNGLDDSPTGGQDTSSPPTGFADTSAPEAPTESDPGTPTAAPPSVRQYFPETLLVEPTLMTDATGEVGFDLELADSITRWRVSTVASDREGRVGSSVDGIDVFQDFFVDIDFPTHLVRNDRVGVPIAVFNYLDTPQDITLSVEPADWLELHSPSSQTVTVEAGAVSRVMLDLSARDVGWHTLEVTAIGTTLSDAVERRVQVRPNGQRIDVTASGSLEAANDEDPAAPRAFEHTIDVPTDAVPGSGRLEVVVRPGASGEILSGVESLLRMPGTTCAEVTMSIAWPNALALDYLRSSPGADPKVVANAESLTQEGYQRVLAFELPSGGFNWWVGDVEGNPMLSAMAMIMLADTERVITIDPAVLERTAQYLFSVQREDGSWPEEHHLKPGNTELGESSDRATCFIAWALAAAGYTDTPGTSRALGYIEASVAQTDDAYTEALCANALAEAGYTADDVAPLVEALVTRAESGEDGKYWPSDSTTTIVGATGTGANVEVTALAIQALTALGTQDALVEDGVRWLLSSRDPLGNWSYSTQATVQALRALLATGTRDSGPTDADVSVRLDGAPLASRHFDVDNEDVVWQLHEGLAPGSHTVTLHAVGVGNMSYQVTGTHYEDSAAHQMGPVVDFDVDVDRDQVAVGESVTATFSVTPRELLGMGMWTLDIAVPAGFAVREDLLVDARKMRVISSHELRDGRLFVYIDEQMLDRRRQVNVELVAERPAQVTLGPFTVYEYYNRERATSYDALPLEAVAP